MKKEWKCYILQLVHDFKSVNIVIVDRNINEVNQIIQNGEKDIKPKHGEEFQEAVINIKLGKAAGEDKANIEMI